MYTYNNFVFGHDLSVNPELNNSVHEFDLVFTASNNGKKFEVSTPYHGGKCNGDVMSVIFGINITDDDNNKNFITQVRNAKEEDYLPDYQILLAKYIDDIQSQKGLEDEEDYDKLIDELVKFLTDNKPVFYSVESSS